MEYPIILLMVHKETPEWVPWNVDTFLPLAVLFEGEVRGFNRVFRCDPYSVRSSNFV